MPVKPPTERDPQPVPGWPGWVWWRGVNGWPCGRRPQTSPPMRASAPNWTAFLAAIAKAEERHQR